MSYYNQYIEKLSKGEIIQFRPVGNSMTPKIYSKQLVTIAPATIDEVDKGDIVLCKVHGRIFVHLVTAKKDGQVQISNNHGHVNGWTTQVFGKVIKVE